MRKINGIWPTLFRRGYSTKVLSGESLVGSVERVLYRNEKVSVLL